MLATDTDAPFRVIGNQSLIERLERDIRAEQLSHAYILDGCPGSGRHTVAHRLCATIACRAWTVGGAGQAAADADQMGLFDMEPFSAPRSLPPDAPLPCGHCPACRKVAEGKHPDIHLIGRDGKATIGVESVRFLREDVLIPPNDTDTKIYIIEDADCMTVQAQNALLLTLEEPPPYVLFLLLCNGAEALLETIRSRAPVLRMEPIADEVVRAYLREKRCSLSEEDMAAVLLRADGCIGQALLLSDARAVKPILKLRELADAFMEACAARQSDTLPAILTRFGNKRDAVQEILALLSLATRDLTLLRFGERIKLKYYTDRTAAEALSARFTTRRLLALGQALDRAADTLAGNGNIRLTLLQLTVDIGL